MITYNDFILVIADYYVQIQPCGLGEYFMTTKFPDKTNAALFYQKDNLEAMKMIIEEYVIHDSDVAQ